MSSITYKTSQEAFIAKNLKTKLIEDGYHQTQINRAIQHAITFYRSSASFRRGKVFDECLKKARTFLSPSKKSAAKIKNRGRYSQISSNTY